MAKKKNVLCFLLVVLLIFMTAVTVSVFASHNSNNIYTFNPANLVFTITDNNMSIAVRNLNYIGRYTEATADGAELLSGYPNAWSSYTTIRIDGNDYYQSPTMDPYVRQPPTTLNDSIVTKWVLPPSVVVWQNLTLMQNTTRYKLVVTNEDHASHSVKVRCLFDVAHDVDDALCWVPGAGAITTEQEFKDLAYWEVKSGYAKSKLTPSCTFTPDNKPDKVQFASWDGIYYVPFDYTITEGRDITSNTAVAMYWALGILAPGETKEVTFYYGIERHSIPSPAEIEITDLFTELDNANQSVKLYADLENDGEASLTNGQLAIIILNPNGERVFRNVSTIAINPNQTISPCFTYNIPVKALSGVYTINATVYDAEMNLLDQREATFSVNTINVSISRLFPPDDVILSSNDVLFSWTTNVNSTTEVYIKPETEANFIKVTGGSGLDHEVIVANLTRDINYTWYAKSSTPSGSRISDNRAFYIDNGIVFTEDTYAFTVERDYNQRVNVSVKNIDSKPHELLVSANNHYKDIFVGFVGDGSVDRILSLNPGETRNITLVIHAQVSVLEDYAFTVGLTNLDAGNIIDYALIHLTVRIGTNIIYVPDDYPKIQTAVDAANPGDTIIVRDGTYTENIDVNKSLTVMSENGAESCIVQAECSDDHIFEVTADYVNISGFTVRSVRKSHDPTIQNAGIHLKSVVHCCISDNIATNNDFGIFLTRSDNNIVTKNIANSNNNIGILLYDSSTNTLTDNTANVNDAGIILYGSSRNTLTGNMMSGNTYNFGISGLSENVMHESFYIQYIDTSNRVDGKTVYYLVDKQNTQIPNDAGFVGIVNSGNITVRDLTLTNNSAGVLLAFATDSRIENITVSNTQAGIQLISSSNNVFYLNNFINNTENVRSYNSTNIWNSTSKIAYTYNGKNYENYLGNYWGDNEENDADEDGIGDTPYRIDLDKDLYPLMQPCKIYFKQLNDTDQIMAGAKPICVVYGIDSSESVGWNDPANLRLKAAKDFTDKLDPAMDSAGVVSWDEDIDFSQSLTNDFTLVKQKIDTIDSWGHTDINVGLKECINVMDGCIDPSATKAKVIIFLSDGNGIYTNASAGGPASDAASKGYKIYSIGLNVTPGGLSEAYLKDMAAATGGKYYPSPSAENLDAKSDLKKNYSE